MKMVSRSLSNRKLFFSLIAIGIALLVGAMFSDQLSAQPPSGAQPDLKIEIRAGEAVVPSEFVGDVRDLPQTITPEERKSIHPPLELEFEVPEHKKPLPFAEPEVPAPIPVPMAPMPTPAISFSALNFNSNGSGYPPDPVGDVGPNHFVEAVNTSVGIYNKATGAPFATFTFNSLWSGAGTGTPCDTIHNGDPTVVYDPQNNRFIVADLSWSSTQNGPYYECIAVSKTSNPVTGGWWLYGFRADDAAHPWLSDYPKMGIWPDGLYMSANMFDCLDSVCGSANYQGVRAFALNLSDLVSGAVLRSVIIDVAGGGSHFSLLPSNYRGTAPPAGRPNLYVGSSTSNFAWEVFKFTPNYVTPASSTFTGPTLVNQASYTTGAGSVPQPAPGASIDTLADRAMMQNQYRSIGGVESLWVNHTTGTASGSTPTGIQWAQINVTGGTVNANPVQQQIYNNSADGVNRFMGSLSVDRLGDMALGFTASSSSVAPDIRYVGRLAADTPSTLPETEVTMLPGLTRSVQTGVGRWGDYSAMTVDPVDDCTFWYTNMYYPAAGGNWVTRIGSFKFPGCIAATPTPTPTPSPTPTPTATATATVPPSPTPTPFLSATIALPVASVTTAVTNFTQPVTATDLTGNDLVGFQGDFNFDSSIVNFQSPPVSPGGLTGTNWNVSGNVFGAGTIKTLRISAFSNDFTPLSGSGTLFILNLTRVSSTPGASTALTWASPPNDFYFIDSNLDSHPPTNTPPGSITIQAATFNISGSITYCTQSNPLAHPVPSVTLTLTGSASGSTTTDGSGNYTLTAVPAGGNYTVTPSKANLAPGTAGIDTVDVIAIQRHFLTLGTPLTGCRLTAADVNGINGVDTVDVIAVQRFFLGLSTGISNAGKYKFNPLTRTYSGVGTDQTAQNYDALIFGDVTTPFIH